MRGPTKKGKPRRRPHQRIMDAARRGAGLRLTADEVWELSQDDAIARAAEWEPEAEDAS